MKRIQTSETKWRCFLKRKEYKKFREEAENQYGDEEPWVALLIRILALSMRVGTLERVRRKHIHEGDRGIKLLKVWEKNSRGNTDRRKPRDIWLPQPLYDDLMVYIRANNIGPEDRVFPDSESTFRRRFKSVRSALAEDNEAWETFTPHDLRRYYAVNFLFRLNLPPALVRQMGGWLSEAAMMEYLILPDDVLVDKLKEQGVMGTEAQEYQAGPTDVNMLTDSFKSLLYELNPSNRGDAINSLEQGLEEIDGVDAELSINKSELRDMEDPRAPAQRRVRMYSGFPAVEIAEMVGQHIETEAMKDEAVSKFKKLCEHPEYVDPMTRHGAAKLTVGAVALLAFSGLWTIGTGAPVSHTAMLSLVGGTLAGYPINQDLESMDDAPAW